MYSTVYELPHMLGSISQSLPDSLCYSRKTLCQQEQKQARSSGQRSRALRKQTEESQAASQFQLSLCGSS